MNIQKNIEIQKINELHKTLKSETSGPVQIFLKKR